MATTERHIRSYLDGEVSLQPPVPDVRVSFRASLDHHKPAAPSLIACSRCLRVLRDERWVRAETVVRELRTFEYDAPPHFEPVLCPLCTSSIHLRRVEPTTRGRHAASRGGHFTTGH